MLPAVPKVVITEKPIGPQLQAPADAPIMVPIILPLIFFVLLINFILNIFIETTIPANIDNTTINEKFNAVSGQTEKMTNGSRNMYSDIIDSENNNMAETNMEIAIYL